jgi:hypothetical protein
MAQWWQSLSEGWKLFWAGTAATLAIGILGWLVTKGIPSMIQLFKQRKLKKLAWILRDYAAKQRATNLNIIAFGTESLANQLGNHSSLIREVIEYMEEKGWAKRPKYGDSWEIF